MTHTAGLVAAVVVASPLAATAWATSPHVLFASGDAAADGTRHPRAGQRASGLSLALRGGTVFVVAPVTGVTGAGSPLTALVRLRGRTQARRLLATGDPSPLGGTIMLRIGTDAPTSVTGKGVITIVDLAPGASARSALLSVAR